MIEDSGGVDECWLGSEYLVSSFNDATNNVSLRCFLYQEGGDHHEAGDLIRCELDLE